MDATAIAHSGIVSPAPVAHSEEQRTFNPRVRRSKLRGGTTNLAALPERMRAKIQPELCPIAGLTDDCWTWTGAIQSKGYGSFHHDGRRQSTHRLAYALLVGPIPPGLQIDHLCDNKRCCNPAHLEPVTGKTNCERTAAALKTMCKHGHRLEGDNLIIKRRASGRTSRNCRKCQLVAQQRSYRRANPDVQRHRKSHDLAKASA